MAIKFLDLEGLKKLWSKVKGRIDTAKTEAISTGNSAVSAEKSERQAADASLSGALASESERAKNAESANATAIGNEISRAESAEAELTADLAGESSRATAKENSLSSALQAETSVRTAKDSVLEESIHTESSSRASADIQLQNLIQAIKSDYITSAQLTSAMSSSLTYKGSVNYINNLPDSHNNGDVYNIIYYGESAQAGTEEWGMNVAWSATDNRWNRLGGVQDLHEYCLKANYMTSAEVTLAITNVLNEAKSYAYSKSQTDSLLSSVNNSISNEKTRAQTAEQKNASDISAEISRAKDAESNLQTVVDSKVRQVKIGSNAYNPSAGVVSLPAYPPIYSAGTGLALSGTTFSVKTGYSTNGRNYPVKTNSDGDLYVNVPWDNTTDVYPWAKQPVKPSYTKDEIGLGNVENTKDSDKYVYKSIVTDRLNCAGDNSARVPGNGPGGLQFLEYIGGADNPETGWFYHLIGNHYDSNGHQFELAIDYFANKIWLRRMAGWKFTDWVRLALAGEIQPSDWNTTANRPGTETWTFTMSDGSVVTKNVYVG